jgi:hypothetical protein
MNMLELEIMDWVGACIIIQMGIKSFTTMDGGMAAMPYLLD